MEKIYIYNEILKYFISVTNLESSEIPKNKSLLEEGYIDSFGVIELIDFIEKKYNMNIRDDEISTENLAGIEKITDFIFKKLKK